MPADPSTSTSSDAGELGTCESCGDEAVEVLTVRRLYLVRAEGDQPERYDPADTVERWCFVCRTHYPHELQG